MKETESAYANNLRTLEDEVAKAHQSKNLQGRNSNVSNSRSRGNDPEERVAKRFEDKLKSKDSKIEELKDNIYTLEETIIKLKRKEVNFEASLAEL